MIGLGVRVWLGTQQRTRPGPLVYDDFNRPDSAESLGNAVTGQTWEVSPEGTYGIQSGRAYLAVYQVARPEPAAMIDAGTADCIVSAEFYGGAGYTSGNPSSGIMARVSDMDNHIRFYPDNGHFRLGRREAGALSVLGSNNAIAPANGQILRMILNGLSIRCYVDDVLVFDISSTFNLNVTKHGFYIRTSAIPTRWDSFRVDKL